MRGLARAREHWSGPRLRRRWLVGALAGALSLVPVMGTLGYFSALLFAPVFTALGVLVGVEGVREWRASPRTGDAGTLLWSLWARAIGELAPLLGIALAVLAVGTLWNRNCDPGEGLRFFLAGPVVSAGLGLTSGTVGAVLSRGRLAQLALGFAAPAGCLALSLWRLWADPVVFAFDPFWGWFAGGIYDESVAVGSRYLWYRAYNLAVAAGCWLSLRALLDGPGARLALRVADGPDRLRLAVAVTLLGVGLFVGVQGDRWRFTATVESLGRELSLTRTTEHFVIHYAPRGRTALEIDDVAIEHEFAWAQLRGQLGVEPAYPVHSFVFNSPDHKRGLFGAGEVEVSLPWKGHIYLHHLPFPHEPLHHELAHTFGSAFGDPVTGLSRRGLQLSPALIEGLANALAPREAFGLDLHDQAAALDRLERRPPLADIMGVGFWRSASTHAYTAAGSFVAWLFETRGVEPVMAVYRTAGDFPGAFGRPLAELEAEWLAFLRARPLRDSDVEALRQRFAQRSIFRRPCAHRVAQLRRDAARAKATGDDAGVVATMRTLCEVEPDRPEHRIGLASVLAELEDWPAAAAELEIAAAMPELTHALSAAIEERRGDLALLAGDGAAARSHYDAAVRYSVRDVQLRTLQIKRAAAEDPRAARPVVDYFQPVDEETGTAKVVRRLFAAVRLSDTPGWEAIGDYLVGRQLLGYGQSLDAATRLRAAVAPGPGRAHLPTPELARAARIALVNALVRTREFDEANAVLEPLLQATDASSGERLEAVGWAARIAFFRAYPR